MPNSLFPAFIRIEYHSDRAPHLMTVPMREYDPVGDEFTAWDLSAVPRAGEVQDFIDDLLPFFTDAVTFDSYTVFTMDTPTASPQPQISALLGDSGTSVSTEDYVAVQETWSFRTTEFGLFKLTLLDAPASVNFLPVRDPTGITAVETMIALVTSDAHAFSGRDNARPATFTQIAYTLNEKLRREYRLN